jgi:uncharacterized protein (DUF302 family)
MRESDSLGRREGLISIPSRFGPKQTTNAAGVGLTLRPTELTTFGNARGGTPLMQLAQTIGIDLLLKALVWQDATGKTWISYTEPGWIVQRHGVANAEHIVTKMADLLSPISTTAAGP